MRRLASCGPQGRIGHARHAGEIEVGQSSQTTHGCIQQSTEDAGPRSLEIAPEFVFRTALLLPNRRQGQENTAVGQIGAANHVFDAIHQERARRLKEDLVVVSPLA